MFRNMIRKVYLIAGSRSMRVTVLLFSLFVLCILLLLFFNSKNTLVGATEISTRIIVNSGSEVSPQYGTKNNTTDEWTKLSTCSDEATKFGPNQKVISFSLFLDGNYEPSRFLDGLEKNLDKMPELYPDWVARVYTNIPEELIPKTAFEKYSFLFWCNVEKLPGLGDLTNMAGMCWRFLPLGDPLVDKFISRDLDSTISKRERLAVEAWENSNFKIHTMRDHPQHGGRHALMGGMWGAKNSLIGKSGSNELQTKIIQMAMGHAVDEKQIDQQILLMVIYLRLAGSTLAHDSYFLGQYPDGLSLPFPTEREAEFYVGQLN